MMVRVGVAGFVAPNATVRVAVAVSPPDCAVIVDVPEPIAVTSPPALTVATCMLLETHCTWVVRFCTPPTPVRFPVAVSCVVSPTKVSVVELGDTMIDGVPVIPPPEEIVTERSEVAITPPDCAVISVYPAPTAVARPEELMDATEGLLDAQVTEFVRLEVVD
jgi:hypothetical protein